MKFSTYAAAILVSGLFLNIARNDNGCVQGSPNGTDRVPKVPDGWIGNRWYPSVCKLGAIFLPISPHLLRCGKLGGLDLSKFQHGVVGILEVNKDGINT